MSSTRTFWKQHQKDTQAPIRKAIADATLKVIKDGYYEHEGTIHDLTDDLEKLTRRTKYYSPDSLLSGWSQPPAAPSTPSGTQRKTEISFLEISTLEGCRYLRTVLQGKQDTRIGVLNFASAKRPGGGFLFVCFSCVSQFSISTLP
jgi:uncharacterized protein (TIGR02452 family)